MISIQRIGATLEGKPTDRRAVSLILPLYGARLTGCEPTEYYTNPTAYAHGQSAVRSTFQPDVLFGPFALPLEGAAFGSRVRFLDNYAPNLERPAITSAGEVNQLEVPDVDSHPKLLYFREAIRLMSSDHGHEVPIAGIVSGPVDLGAMILGIDGWLNTLLFDETGTKRMIGLMSEFFVQWANALLSDGAMFVVLPTNFANPSIVTRKISSEIAVPAMKEAFPQVGGPIFIHSGGSPLAPFLDLFANLPNVAGFVLNGDDNFQEAREKVGSKPILVGNIDGLSLIKRDRDEVRANCMAVLKDRRADPHFILGTSGADIDYHAPPENIHIFREAAEEFARENA